MNPKSAKKKPPRTPRPVKCTLSSSSDSSTSSLHEPVGVYCRLRPLDDESEASCVKLISPTVLCLSPPSDAKLTKPDIHCTFKYIFTGYSSQREVYDYVALPLLKEVLFGRNALLFTYGITGSGKTFTLTGEQNNPGIMPRVIYTIFNSIGDIQSPKHMIKSDHLNGFELQTEADAEEDRLLEQKQNQRSLKRRPNVPRSCTNIYENDGTTILAIKENNLYAVFISYTEIYNNTVYDLLDESGAITKTLQSKIIREDSNKNMYVNAVCEVEVKSAEEAFELFNLGQKRKRMAQTVLNSESSRSHSIFNIRVVQLEQPPQNGVIAERNVMKVAQLSLVDLAGSERTNRTQNTGSRLKEASNINNSLMCLRNCMEILRENQLTGSNRLVPYRDSRLTLLFKNYFEGDGRVEMIVCTSPSCLDYDENVQVMRFAEMTQEVRVARPLETRFTPYRKRTAIAANMETPTPVKKISTRKPVNLFGPKLHQIHITLDESAGGIRTLMKLLNSRKERAVTFSRDVNEKIQQFRKRLLDIQQESVLKKNEITNLKQLYNKEKAQVASHELKLQDMDSEMENIRAHNEELLEMIQTQRITIDEKDVRLNRTYLEKEKSKQKFARQTEKIGQELDEKLRRQREHLNAEMKAKEVKLQQVRAILDDKTAVKVPSVEDLPMTTTITGTPRPPMMSQMPSCTSMQSGRRRPIVGTPVSATNQSAMRRRRSRSAGDRWLEHDTVRPVALGTVLQPAMKRRKSVTKLTKASDVVHPKQSKYCLIAQEADTDGEVETKLYKADIVPTCGGGAQVIFNDVECLRQESPTGIPR